MREHVKAVEKARRKMVGLMMGCRRDHGTAVYAMIVMRVSMRILVLM